MDRRSWTMLLALAAIWGASYMLIKVALDDLSPAMIAWTRIALAAAVLVPIAAAQGVLRIPRERGLALIVLALVSVAAPFWLISAGEQEVSSALTGILVASTPLFTALLAIRVDHEERSHGAGLAGVALGFGGVGALLGLDLGGGLAALAGGLAIVLAGLGYAVGGFVVKHRFADLKPVGVAAWVMVVSAIALAPLAALEPPASLPGAAALGSIAALGVLGTGIAFVIFYALNNRVGPARTAIVTYLCPAFAVVYGVTLLGESISIATVIGLAMILAGSWLAIDGRLPVRRRGDGREASGAPARAPEPDAGRAFAYRPGSPASRRSSGAGR